MRSALSPILGIPLMMSLLACSGTSSSDLGVVENELSPCPSRPNCVTSDADDAEHRIEPLRFQGDPTGIWTTLKTVVAGLPRTEIATSDEHYLHAEASSKLFGFIDDIEFHLRPAEGLIAVRSAARTGYSDMGVNAERIEAIRQALRARGLVP